MNRIQKITDVRPYKITCEWSNGEVRIIDFESKLSENTETTTNVYESLKNRKVFMTVKIDRESQTIYWEDLLTMVDLDGKTIKANLDFCPDTLYDMSVPLNAL
jgi:hypothetical protein